MALSSRFTSGKSEHKNKVAKNTLNSDKILQNKEHIAVMLEFKSLEEKVK